MFKRKDLTPYRLQINRHRNQYQKYCKYHFEKWSSMNRISRTDIPTLFLSTEEGLGPRENRVNSWYTQYARVIRYIRIAITRGRPTAEVKPRYFKTSFPNSGCQYLTIEWEGTGRVPKSRVKDFGTFLF